MYAGPYFEYQVNKNGGGGDVPLVEYNSNNKVDAGGNVVEYKAESVYNPVISTGATKEGINRMALGGKVGVIFDFGGNKAQKVLKAKQTEIEAALEAARLEELRRKAEADSLANLAVLEALRQQALSDSIANAARLAELRRLAEEQRIKDSIAAAKLAKVQMELRSRLLSEADKELLKLPIGFERGKSEITGQSKLNAMKIAKMLSKYPKLKFEVVGHTCDLGSAAINHRLGLNRAKSFTEILEGQGNKAEKIITDSKGEMEPMVPNTDEDNRRQNRRVVVKIEDDFTGESKERVIN